MIYRPCPKCKGKGSFFAAHKQIAWFECEAGHIYTVQTADNGLVLEVRAA